MARDATSETFLSFLAFRINTNAVCLLAILEIVVKRSGVDVVMDDVRRNMMESEKLGVFTLCGGEI